MKYICDCDKNTTMTNEARADQGRGKWSLVEVDTEECCVWCGHYAMQFRDLKIQSTGTISPIKLIEEVWGDHVQKKKRKKDPFNGMYGYLGRDF